MGKVNGCENAHDVCRSTKRSLSSIIYATRLGGKSLEAQRSLTNDYILDIGGVGCAGFFSAHRWQEGWPISI